MTRAAFFVVKKFHVVYRSFKERTPRGIQLYSLPQEGVEADAVPKKYRGLDREPLEGVSLEVMAMLLRNNPSAIPIPERAACLAIASAGAEQGTAEHLLSFEDACNVYLTLGDPEGWEIVWARLSEAEVQPPLSRLA